MLQILGAILTGLIVVSTLLGLVQWIRCRITARVEMELTVELLREEFAAAARMRVSRQAQQPAWLGFRNFQVERKIKDGPSSDSYWLVPQDGRSLPTFQPGQYLTVRVRMPGQSPDQKEIVERRYPITSEPNEEFYCISVERAPDMMLSGCLHQGIAAGTVVDVLAPRGELCLDEQQHRPIVLIADGVGTKPCVSMLETAAESIPDRPITVVYGVRNGRDHGIGERLGQLSQRLSDLQVVAVESDPDADDSMLSCRLDFGGSISIDTLRSELPSNNFDFQLWGPATMVESLRTELAEWGVPEDRVRAETFGAPLAPVLEGIEFQALPQIPAASDCCNLTWKPAAEPVAEEVPPITYSRVLKNPARHAERRRDQARDARRRRPRAAIG